MVAETESSDSEIEEKCGPGFTSTNGLHKPDSEVILYEEKCGPGFTSANGLHKPGSEVMHHYDDQPKDPNCSDIPEVEDGDISSNILNDKDVLQESSAIVPQDNTGFVGQGTGSGVPSEQLEDVGREFDQLLGEDNVSNLKGTDGELFLLNGATSEHRNSAEVGDWVQDWSCNILEDNDGDSQYCSEFPNTEPATSNLKLESGAPNSSFASCGETTGHLAVTCANLVPDLSNVSNEGAENISLELTELNLDRHLESASDNDENLLENNGKSSISMDSTDDSSAIEAYLDRADTESVAKPFNFFARIPRFNDESLREQITVSKLNIEEKTKIREAIQVQIQEKRADNQIRSRDYKNSKIEHRKAWDLVTLKRMEIDSVLSLINKAKNAMSIRDIDSQIYNMERMIQHETRTLKEEKQLLLEIKRLKQLRGELSSNLGSQAEIKQVLEQREELEDRLKVLRKELDVLKGAVRKAETAVVKAAKKYEDGYKKLKELQVQFREANEVRQAAYTDLQRLRKELQDKNKYFFKYKNDAAAVSICASKRDNETLHRLCMDQVENFMKLWNDNEEFRKEYVKFNMRSTIKRLGTLDGRSLGPEEEPPILPNFAGGTVEAKTHKANQVKKLKQETTVENMTETDVIVHHVETLKLNGNHKKLTDMTPAEHVAVNEFTVIAEDNSSQDVLEKSVEEIELERREEEAKLKAQRRLEELVKANEARERKKRQAEKEQLRARLKALKESELKEKEREKKLRKKQKAAEANDTHKQNEAEANANAENVAEMGLVKEAKDTSDIAHKKANNSKPLAFSKQSKNKPVPPPLRNRNKKYYRQWLLVGASCVGIIVLFWLGNLGAFYKANLKRPTPASLAFR